MSPINFSPKAISFLEMNSPFFDALWPIIFDVADHKTKGTLHLTHSYFRGMWDRADIKYQTDLAKAKYEELIAQHSFPKDCRIDCPSSPWYSWGTYGSSPNSHRGFHEFCAIAGVDPESGQLVHPKQKNRFWVYLSTDKDLIYLILRYPLSEYHDGYVYHLVCTGEREKSRRLREWWLNNGAYLDIVRVIDVCRTKVEPIPHWRSGLLALRA